MLLFSNESLTYQHVLPAFVSAGVTVEMLSKAWFYMGTFVLQNKKYQGQRTLLLVTSTIYMVITLHAYLTNILQQLKVFKHNYAIEDSTDWGKMLLNRAYVCKHMTHSCTCFSYTGQKMYIISITLWQTTMKQQQGNTIALVALIIIIQCCNQTKTVECEHISISIQRTCGRRYQWDVLSIVFTRWVRKTFMQRLPTLN